MGAAKFVEIERCLADLDVSGLSVVEVGTEHEGRGDGSTRFFNDYCRKRELEFWTVDLDPDVAAYAKALTPNAIHASGETFLAGYPSKRPIVFAYLDNFDWTYPGVESVPKVQRQAERYRTVHHVERNNDNSRLAHLKQATALLPLLHTTAFVLFDDTWTNGSGYDGKGGTAVPFLMQNGFTVVSEGGPECPHVLLRRS